MALKRLEPCAGKLACTVLRGANCSNAVCLLGEHEILIFLGHQSSVEILDGKLNHDGHRLPHYLKAVNKNMPHTIFRYLHSLLFNNNDRERLLDYELAQLLVEI